jgi:hypothetical protein
MCVCVCALSLSLSLTHTAAVSTWGGELVPRSAQDDSSVGHSAVGYGKTASVHPLAARIFKIQEETCNLPQKQSTEAELKRPFDRTQKIIYGVASVSPTTYPKTHFILHITSWTLREPTWDKNSYCFLQPWTCSVFPWF